MTAATISLPQRMLIAATAITDVRSVARAYSGLPVRGLTLARIAEAARKLGLPLPPGAATESPTPRAA